MEEQRTETDGVDKIDGGGAANARDGTTTTDVDTHDVDKGADGVNEINHAVSALAVDSDNEDEVIPIDIDEDAVLIRSAGDGGSSEDPLEEFRRQWQTEIGIHPANISDVPADNREDEALRLHMIGMSLEDAGHLNEAISYYRRAARLEPMVEFRAAEITRKENERKQAEQELENIRRVQEEEKRLTDGRDEVNLEEIIRGDAELESNYTQRATHVSVIPWEIWLKIFQFTVLLDLNFATVEQLSMTCKYFYKLARQAAVWRIGASMLQYPKMAMNAASLNARAWRLLIIQRPRVHFNGLYISHVSYLRQGLQSLDGYYRPVHVVEYYRYLRFFPDGTVISLSSPEEPTTTIPKLKTKAASLALDNVLHGTFELGGQSELNIAVKSAKAKQNNNNNNNQNNTGGRRNRARNRVQTQVYTRTNFYMTMAIQSVKASPSKRLNWERYTARQDAEEGEEPHFNEYDLNEHFKPFFFARVKSYDGMY